MQYFFCRILKECWIDSLRQADGMSNREHLLPIHWITNPNGYKGLRPWIILISTTTTAITSRIWMNPLITKPLIMPISHKIKRTTKIIHSICAPFRNIGPGIVAPRFPAGARFEQRIQVASSFHYCVIEFAKADLEIPYGAPYKRDLDGRER